MKTLVTVNSLAGTTEITTSLNEVLVCIYKEEGQGCYYVQTVQPKDWDQRGELIPIDIHGDIYYYIVPTRKDKCKQ